ncbi:MAG TPA: copper-binding protein [Gammaproteobacteria bacterium]
MKSSFYAIVCAGCVLTISPGLQAESKVPALDPGQHPETMRYESLFPDAMVPLDTELSWKNRFLGNESFNRDESLPSTGPELESDAPDQSSAPGDGMPAGQLDATGVIKQIKASEGKLKIAHGPIERLGMPAMTMMFRVEDPARLEGLSKGDEVAFNVDNTAAGFSITRLETAGGSSGKAFDASGTIRSIRASQGKVKIEHGPIDRLGMPGMTMVFKLQDTDALQNLEQGMPVEFDVVNAPGGFEITRIQPVGASVAAPSTGVKRICYSIGPFLQQARAVALSRRYREQGASSRVETRAEREYLGDMVYIDGHASPAAALATASDLAAKGIGDSFVLDLPGKPNVLSLGVFSQQQNANRLKARVKALNYSVKTEARYRQRTTYWLHNEQSGGTPPKLLSAGDVEAGVREISGECAGEDS